MSFHSMTVKRCSKCRRSKSRGQFGRTSSGKVRSVCEPCRILALEYSHQPRRLDVEYRDVPGWVGYQVGSDGSLWSLWRRVSFGGRTGTKPVVGGSYVRLVPYVNDRGYAVHGLRNGRRIRQVGVHILVLEAFSGMRPAGMEARHGPRGVSDNSADNLRWGTHVENEADKVRDGTRARGESVGGAKLTEPLVRAVRRMAADGVSCSSIAGQLGVSRYAVYGILAGKTWRHVA